MITERRTQQEELTDAVVRAGRYEGHASAMVITFYMTDNPERAAIWEAEEVVWQERGDRLIENARVGHAELRAASLDAHIRASLGVDPVGTMRAADPNFK